MTEENETPKEAQPEPTPQKLSEDIRRIVAAFNLSKTATGYTEGNSEVPGNIVSGSGAVPNPTLSRFIKIAEKVVIKELQQTIIKKAGELIETELDKIRGLLG